MRQGAARRFLVGNWKMHGLRADMACAQEIDRCAAELPQVSIGLAPPVTLLLPLAERLRHVRVGGQACHAMDDGAYTGGISARMLTDGGGDFVILGHSEQRAQHCYGDEQVRAQALAAQAAGLDVILCVGEGAGEREAGRALPVVVGQVLQGCPNDAGSLLIAYEPVWAIGSGDVPAGAQIEEMHGAIRCCLKERFGEAGRAVPILYGGSVSESNAAQLLGLTAVDGLLVGAASLSPVRFCAIARAAAYA
ncbi:MAG: triose-phosphate isomerase [Sphingomonadales bacterium]|nr:triose-phosphate isomerase [Sphingomonadales bacterium]MDE2170464.1 triose-phosphate isomerase [Sphingomonadales bacterium]